MRRGEKAERGECPVCLDMVPVTVDGTLRRHPLWATNKGYCEGTGQTPAVHVHRCACGARWDEHAEGTVASRIGCGRPSQLDAAVPCGRHATDEGEQFFALCADCAGRLLDGTLDA